VTGVQTCAPSDLAAILLVLYAATAVPKTPAKAITRDDFRRAA